MSPIEGGLISVQVGLPKTYGTPEAVDILDQPWRTGFFKARIEGPVRVLANSLEGDGQADLENHGGADKSILLYSADHYDRWRQSDLPMDLPFGGFGENLTVADLDETNVCIGDRWIINDVAIEVSQPRQPCWKLARRWRMRDLPKHVVKFGYTGWYARVLQTGTIQAGDAIRLIDRPHPQSTIQQANDVLYRRVTERSQIIELAGLPELSASWKMEIYDLLRSQPGDATASP